MEYLTVRIGNADSKEGWNKETGRLRNVVMEVTAKAVATDKILNKEILRRVDEQWTLGDTIYRYIG